jgi:hypothetical protein
MSYYTFDAHLYLYSYTFFSLFLLPFASYFLQLVLPNLSISKFCVPILGAFENCDNRILSTSCLSLLPLSVRLSAWHNSTPTGRVFKKFNVRVFSENPSRRFKFNNNQTKIKGILREDRYTVMFISRSIILKTRNVSGKIVLKMKTRIIYSLLFFPENPCRLCSNMEKYGRNR